MTEDLGTPTLPHVLTGEQWRLEVRTDNPPSPSDDERWIRSDLDGGDRVATLKCGDGTEIPLFATGTAEETVREARRFRVGGQTVYAPLAPVNEAAFPARRVQHDGQTHAFHNRVRPGPGIPDSVIHYWPADEGSGATIADTIGTADITNFNGTWSSDTAFEGGTAPFFDRTDDDATATPQQPSEFTWAVKVRPDSLSDGNIYTIFAHDFAPRLAYQGFVPAWEFTDNGGNAAQITSDSPAQFNGSDRYLFAQLSSSGLGLYLYDETKTLIDSATTANSDATYSNSTLGIGDDLTGSGTNRRWRGNMDNWRFFNTALSQSERQDFLAEM